MQVFHYSLRQDTGPTRFNPGAPIRYRVEAEGYDVYRNCVCTQVAARDLSSAEAQRVCTELNRKNRPRGNTRNR